MSSASAPFDYYVARIGPWHFDKGPTVFYTAFTPDGDYVEGGLRQPPNDRAALQEIAAALPTGRRACSPELSEHGRDLGFEILPMPPEVAQARATTALLATWQTKDRIGLDVADRIARACPSFFEAAPWGMLKESKRRRTTWELISDGGREATAGTIEILADDGARGPGIVLRDTHDIGMNTQHVRGVQARGRLRLTLSTEPACIAAAMADAHGLRRFPRISDVCDEVLFPLSPVRLVLAAQALRAATGMAKAPSEPAVAKLTHEGLLLRFTIHPGDIEPADETPPEGSDAWLRALARDAARKLYETQPGVMLGCDSVLCSPIDDPLALKIAEADAAARRRAKEPPAKVLLLPKDKPVVRASWLRVPPLMKLIQQRFGREMIDFFLAENPVDSIRVLLVREGRGWVYDVDRDPTEVQGVDGVT
jgi:hypothetical protein